MKEKTLLRLKAKLLLLFRPIGFILFSIASKLKATHPTLDVFQVAHRYPDIKFLSSDKAYFVLHASFADKWMILSFLGEHLRLYPQSVVIAYPDDMRLAEIFLGSETVSSRFYFVNTSEIQKLLKLFNSGEFNKPLLAFGDGGLASTHTLQQRGLPLGSVRSLHIVHYPYFPDLFLVHGVTYSTLQKTLLYLSGQSKPVQPTFFLEADYAAASKLLNCIQATSEASSQPHKCILFNAVNHSHVELSQDQLRAIVNIFTDAGYKVFLNIAQAESRSIFADLFSDVFNVFLLSVPPHLLSIVSGSVTAVVGVIGGAMNIAAQYSTSHILSLQTPYQYGGYPDQAILGKYAAEKLWEMYGEDWPVFSPGRIVENVFLGDPAGVSSELLCSTIYKFVARLEALSEMSISS